MSQSFATHIVVNSGQREYECWQLRSQGATYQQISDMLGLGDRKIAWRADNRVLRRLRKELKENAQGYIDQQLSRYDLIFRTHLPKIDDPQSAAIVLRAQAQQAALLGLNAPERREEKRSTTLTFRLIEEKLGVEGGDE